MKGTGSFFLSILAGILFALWLLGLWILSSLPGDDVQLPAFPGADKLAHFLYFAVGGLLLAWFLRRTLRWRGWKVTCSVLLTMALIGGLDEFHQLYTPDRSGADPLDWLADATGGFLGAVVIGWLYVRGRDQKPRAEGRVVAQGD
ncbi:MAG TPA: VanZ family protein [Terrimicrobiaceae bacterium]